MARETTWVELPETRYPILFEANWLAGTSASCRDVLAEHVGKTALVVSNQTVVDLYGDRLMSELEGVKVDLHLIPEGEANKTLAELEKIIGTLIKQEHTRETTLIALGGGVVGDMTGFAAAIYQRGVPFLQVPTTLLAQVDSSVGGKTAVNHALGKNMIGAFHQPRAVLMDVAVLKSLPPREFAAGMAEIVKHALLADVSYLDWLIKKQDLILQMDDVVLSEMVRKSCEIKSAIVAEDEKEQGRRALLNLGHTFGHAIETLSGYGQCLHGEAVAIGTVMAADLSARHGWISEADVERIVQLLRTFNLPTELSESLDIAAFQAAMGRDKKARASGLRLVLLRALGRAEVVSDFDERLLSETLVRFLKV